MCLWMNGLTGAQAGNLIQGIGECPKIVIPCGLGFIMRVQDVGKRSSVLGST